MGIIGKRELEQLVALGKFLDFRGSALPLLAPAENGLLIPAQLRDGLIENMLWIRSKKKGAKRLRLNRAQWAYSRRCTKRNIVLKARQLGITTYIAARYFIHTITQPGTTTVQVAHNQDAAEEIFKIVHRFWEHLPEATKRGALVTSHANVREIVFPGMDSEYRVATAADPNAGRGMTIHHLHCSEVSRWPRDGADTLASLRAAVPEDGEVVLESTPNGASGIFYEEWQKAEETGYTRHFFPWWFDDNYVVDLRKMAVLPYTEEELDLAERAGLSEAQIGWRRIHRAQLRDLAEQEFPEDAVSCFKASAECVFDLDAVRQALDATGEPIEMQDNRRLLTWMPPQAAKQYIIGVDPAGGGAEGDYACAEVVDRASAMQCAELHGHFAPRELAGKVKELGRKYNDALIVVERNNHGHAVLTCMEDYPNLFHEGKQPGWLTSAVSRPAMIENLAEILVTQPLLLHSPKLLNECRTFVRHADGSTAAAPGSHDDCVMAMAIALGARKSVTGDMHSRSDLQLGSLRAR